LYKNQIQQAIREKRVVNLRYDQDILDRVIEPYALYQSTQGKILVFGIQLRNNNKPLTPTEPRHFETVILRSITLTDKHFQADPSFSVRNIKGCSRVIVSI
jgi:hypothetical protein